jgi:hypothetical protein
MDKVQVIKTYYDGPSSRIFRNALQRFPNGPMKE